LVRRSWLLIAEVALLGVLAGLAFPSDGSGYVGAQPVSLTASGPSPSTLTMTAGQYMVFYNKDSVTHTVVFANGRCSLTITPGEWVGPSYSVNGSQHPECNNNVPFYVGSYPYTVDGKVPGMVETTPAFRSVTLTARTHRVWRGQRLTLHGTAKWDNNATSMSSTAPFPVIVLARHAGAHAFKVIATVTMPVGVDVQDSWHLKVRPGVATTYIAELTGQLPGGEIWQQATSRPFTVRMRR
jgi:plastocyanin